MSYSQSLLLRPHHGMCLFFFKGEGYCDAFTEHMSNVQKILDTSLGSAALIRLTLRTDEICAACPHNIDGVCEHDERALRYDKGVLRACGLSEGMVMSFSEFSSLIVPHIFEAGLRKAICGGCQWNYICENL